MSEETSSKLFPIKIQEKVTTNKTIENTNNKNPKTSPIIAKVFPPSPGLCLILFKPIKPKIIAKIKRTVPKPGTQIKSKPHKLSTKDAIAIPEFLPDIKYKRKNHLYNLLPKNLKRLSTT